MPIFLRRISMRLIKLKNSALIAGVLLFVLVSSTCAYLIEPDTFGSWFNALYWILTTMATVGYGDYYATTVAGKILTIFIYIFGIGLLSLIIGKIIDGMGEYQKRRESGKLRYQGTDHIIIINWSKKAQYAIDELLSCDSNIEIVILDEGDKHPYVHAQVQFVSGDPANEATLLQANITDARSAIIFADARIDEPALVDGKSLLITCSIESIAPHVHTTVEIMLEKHIRNFRHVHVNEFILSHDAVSRLAVRSALNEGSIDIFTQLLSRQHGADLFPVPVRSEWKCYKDAFQALLLQGATLISNKGDMTINQQLNHPIPADAQLFVVCNPDVHQHIINEGK